MGGCREIKGYLSQITIVAPLKPALWQHPNLRCSYNFQQPDAIMSVLHQNEMHLLLLPYPSIVQKHL